MNLKFLAFKYRYAPLFYLRKHEEALQNALIIPYDSEEENSPYLRFGDRYKAVESKTSQKSSYKIFAPTPLLAAREIFKAIKLSKKDSLLDIGCGTGNFNYFAYLYEPKLSQNHGIDINLDLINIGKNYFNQKNVDEKINLFQKDFFKNQSLLSEYRVIYHYDNFYLEALIPMIKHWLDHGQPHSRMVLSIPKLYLRFIEEALPGISIRGLGITALIKLISYDTFVINR